MSLTLPSGEDADLKPAPDWSDAEIERSRRLGAMALRHLGVPVKKIAKYYNVHRDTIRLWLKDVPSAAADLVAEGCDGR